MSDNRKVAGRLLQTAAKTIMKDRPGIHGSAENSFEMIGDLWTVYLRHARRVRGVDTIRPEDVAEMMTMLKKARKIYGDPMNDDNDVDDLGYAALGGMLRLPDPEKDPVEEMEETLRRGHEVEESKAEPYDPSVPLKPNWDATFPETRADGGANIKTKHTDIRSGERSPGEILKSLYGLNTQPEG